MTNHKNQTNKFDYYKQRIGLILGPLVAGMIIIFCDLTPGNSLSTKVAALALWMAIWWITEVVDLAITALLPIIFLPICKVLPAESVAALYFNSITFLFLGGFIIAFAMQKWNLHKRLAILIISLFNTKPESLLLGFMLATGFISMWMSNTATCMMILPIALALITKFENSCNSPIVKKFSTALLLGVAYASSIGGIATLIGTPPNLVFAHIYKLSVPSYEEISFLKWMIIAFPVSIIMLFLTWLVLCKFFIKKNTSLDYCRSTLQAEKESLGKMSYEEIIILIVFLVTAILWITRSDMIFGGISFKGWSNIFNTICPSNKLISFVDDGTVGILMAFTLFLIPSKKDSPNFIMTWNDTKNLPWGILLLFGGGFALAKAFIDSGLTLWISQQLQCIQSLDTFLMIVIICIVVTFLTELTSNTATTQILLPILVPIAITAHINPLLLMIPGTIAASSGFMMPVGTPPNTIVFGTKRITMFDMTRVGLILNLIGVIVISVVVYLILTYVFSYS